MRPAQRTPTFRHRATVLLLASTCLTPLVAPAVTHAQDAMWLLNPATNNFNVASNWSPAAVPTGTATFGASNLTSISIAGNSNVGAFQFNAGSPAYSFTIGNPAVTLNVNGAGFVNNSSSKVAISNSGTLNFNNSSTADTASITNTGNLRFRNTSTAASSTVLVTSFSDLSFGDASTAGNAHITVNSGGNIIFTNQASAGNAVITVKSGNVAFFGSSTGAQARFITDASSTFDISGLNAPSLTVGSIEGGGLYTLDSNQLIVGANNLSTTLSAVIADGGTGGSLMKIGTGTLTLSSANSYTGGTTVSAGGLIVNGSLTSGVTVATGAMLGGSGQIGGDVINSGTVTPGRPGTTLTAGGNYEQTAGGTYQVTVNPAGQSSFVAVSGSATLGGSVSVLAAMGSYARNTIYTILHANGGINGVFSGVTSNFAFLAPSLAYDGNNVFLTLFQTSGAFANGAKTPNQRAVGMALDKANATATGDFNTVLNALSALPTAQGPAALTAISGQAYSGFASANVQNGAVFMNAVGQQMGYTHTGAGGSGGASSADNGGNRVALAEACDALADSCDTGTASRWGAWMSAVGGVGNVQGNSNAGALGYNVGGTAVGADYRIDPHLLAGVSVAYGHGTQWTSGVTGNGTSDSYNASVYGSFTSGAVYVDALAGYAYNDNHMTRSIVIPGLAPRVALGQTGANQFFGQVEGGYAIGLSQAYAAYVTPFARLQASTTSQAAFTETGANSLDLSVAQQTTNSLRSVIGIDLGAAFDMGWREKLALKLRLGWGHEYADVSRPVSAAFAGAPGAGFTVFGAAPQRDGAVLGLSATTAIAEQVALYLRYDGEVGGGTSNHAISAGVRLTW